MNLNQNQLPSVANIAGMGLSIKLKQMALAAVQCENCHGYAKDHLQNYSMRIETMAEKIQVVCPYCGGGCMLNLVVENGAILGAEPAPGRINQSELCLKGYYGWDFLNDTKRLTPRLKKPLMRLRRSDHFEEVSW